MTSSENLSTLDPWAAFRLPFAADSWLTDATNDSLTKALQKSLSSTAVDTNAISDSFVSDLIAHAPETPSSNLSGSDHEVTAKRQRGLLPVSASGKVSKRKSRASKRTQTTFITADPANFRQMVQQVTGVRFGSSQMPLTPILKPEPQRPGSRLPSLSGGVGCLPTLDTSAFLLDHHQQMGPGPGPVSGSSVGGGSFPFQGSLVGGGDGGLEFETFPSFPTLESWKVM